MRIVASCRDVEDGERFVVVHIANDLDAHEWTTLSIFLRPTRRVVILPTVFAMAHSESPVGPAMLL